MAPLRLAIIGCGKVTERFHLPVARASDGFDVTVLVDPDLPRARVLAGAFSVARVQHDVEGLAAHADAAIVAAPHHLHAAIASDLLDQGLPVLLEKPMALSVAECDALIDAAREAGVVLAVGLVRRYYAASRLAQQLVSDGVLGAVTGFDLREGAPFSWQVASAATFRKEAGGGVLTDTGAHALDLLLWWLGDHAELAYFDDAMGGVETDCELHLTMASGARGVVELSRTRTLRNSFRIVGDRASLEVGPGFDPELRLTFSGHEAALAGHASGRRPRAQQLEDVFAEQLDDFGSAIREDRAPFVPGPEGRRSVALIEACRAVRQPLVLPWLTPGATAEVTT